MRQAARHLKLDEAAYALLSVQSTGAPPGDHCFGVYRWQKQGVRPDEMLVAVASNAGVEAKLLDLLPFALTTQCRVLARPRHFEELDARHYEKWREALGRHIAGEPGAGRAPHAQPDGQPSGALQDHRGPTRPRHEREDHR